ncbi:hypothetical protein EYR40_008121 [Pleurotus pulmonarius]|nr:hypothetical protein EYR40_008121 [Pleurotus pulmonarius]
MHPRQSILSMFDPLNQSTSLDNNSEKENATPTRAQKSVDGMTMTAFFNRTYKPTLQPMQPTFTRRLVDVGDVTVDEFSIMSLGLEELNEESEMDVDYGDEGDTTVLAPHDLPPLVDEHTAEEPVTPKAVRSHIHEFSTHQDCTPPASISNEFTNYEAHSGHSENHASPLALPTIDAPPNHLTIPLPDSSPPSPEALFNPVITISSPVAASPTHCFPLPVTGGEEGDLPVILPTSSSLTLRPRKPTDIAIDDPRRCSVDLQQSFCLQMQEVDSSFDLLNDKISFFASAGGPGMETSFDEDDDSFDIQVKALGRTQEASKDKTKGTDTISPSLDDFQTPTDTASGETEALTPVETPLSTPQLSPKNASPSIAKFLDDADDNTELMKKAFHTRAPPINSSATPKPTTLSMAPPPVHALKIVKRSRLQQPTQARRRSSNLPEEINVIRPSSSNPVPLPSDATKDSSSGSKPARVPSQAPRFKPPRPPVPKLVQGTSASSTASALSGAPARPTIFQGISVQAIGAARTTRAVTSPALPPTMAGPPARRVPLGIPDTKTPSVSANSPAGVLKPSRIPGKVYDYVLTFRLEYHYVWSKQQWSLIQVLFFVNRYMPFVDITLSLYAELVPSLSEQDCQLVYQLAAFFSVRLPQYEYAACILDPGNGNVYLCWILVLVYDTGTMILMAVAGAKSYTQFHGRSGASSALVRTLYRDGIIYYIGLFVLSVANIITVLVLPRSLVNLFTLLQRAVHTVLSSRVILHLREQAGKHTTFSDTLIATYSSIEPS